MSDRESPAPEAPQDGPRELEIHSFRRDERTRAQRLWDWIVADLDGWARERSWEARVPLLLFFAYLLATYALGDSEHQNFLFGGINLAIHEAGHVIFRPFGTFLMLAGGTIAQLAAPWLAGFGFWRGQRDYFALAFCWAWLGTSLLNCAVYASDARGQRNLALVSPWGQSFGSDGNGDWTRMLERLGLLTWDTTIAGVLRFSGYVSFLLALAWGAYVLWRMHEVRRLPPPPPPEWAR